MMQEVSPVDPRVLKVLLVEDNKADAMILTSFLNEGGTPLAIDLIRCGDEAVQYLHQKGPYASAPVPDVVLLDINLPKRNGFEVLAEMRQTSRTTDVPVFVISSSSNPDDLRRGQALGVAGYFVKPTDVADFEKLAANLVRKEFPKYVLPKPANPATLKAPGEGAPAFSQSNELFKQLVDEVKDYAIFMLDSRGYVLTWNDGAEHLKGYRPSEIIGKHFSIFYPKEALDRDYPAYELEMASKTGRYHDEGWRLRKDGTRFWANVTITAVRSRSGELIGFGKVTRDFTAEKEAEKHLKDSERRFRHLVEQVKDYAIFMLNPDGTIASWNMGAERINGYKASEIIGRHFSVFYTKEALEKHHPDMELRIAREKGVYEEEGLRVRKDGTSFWANVVITALFDEEDKLQGFSKVTRDITERKRTEEKSKKTAELLEERVRERTVELEQSKRELTYQRDRLTRSNTDLQQFAYVASHDLQEPLRAVVSCLQLIERRYLSDLRPEVREYMGLAVEGAQRMKALIEGLLVYSRVGHSSIQSNLVDFHAVVESAKENLRGLLLDSKAVIVVSPLPSLRVDVTQMTQLFQNLIGNAIKYRSAHPPRVEISATATDDVWRFSVKDNGIGIDPQYFDRIFAIFQRLHSDRDKYPGTGIGLALCKKIVEGHGGRILVDSTAGQGTTFFFTLPK